MTSNQWKLDNLKRAKRVVLSMTVPTLAMVGLLWFDAARAESPTITGAPIPYDHLSSEESEPFGNYGKPPMRNEEIRAAKRFTDVRSCLVRAEQSKDRPDLRKINWARMNNKAAIDVCMFRIFASYGTPEKAVLWFDAQGLRTEGPVEVTFSSGLSIGVHGYNSPANSQHVYVSNTLWGGWFKAWFIYVESFAASWDESGVLTNTSYSASSK